MLGRTIDSYLLAAVASIPRLRVCDITYLMFCFPFQ
jgi:hypothetical protein